MSSKTKLTPQESFAGILLANFHWNSIGGGAFGSNAKDSILLIISGAITAGPLMLMSYAAQKLPLATVGILQYVNPSLQFICAVLIFSEPFSTFHAVTFGLIWAALIIYSWSEFRSVSR